MLNELMAPLYMLKLEKLNFFACCSIVRISLEHGLAPEASYGFAMYGGLIGHFYGDYHQGYAFGRLAADIGLRFRMQGDFCRACYILGNNIQSWVRPLSETDALFRDGYRAGLDAGDLQFAGYFLIYLLLNPLFRGASARGLLEELPASLRFAKRTKHTVATHSILGLLLALRDLTGDAAAVAEEALTEEQYLKECEAHQTRYALCHYQILKAMCLYLHGLPAEALRLADEAEENLGFLAGKFQTAALRFYRALALAALLPEAAEGDRARLRADLDACRERLRGWAESCPANFAHKHALVEAEAARLDGRVDEAARLYEQAIALGRQHAFVNIEALACELAGRFWMSRGRTRVSLDFLTDALQAYGRWGLDRKIALLTEEFPLIKPGRERGARADVFDAETLLKAARVLSEELVVERLLSSMVQVLVENAGAERGALLLVRGDDLALVALGTAHPPASRALPSIPLEDQSDEVCASAVRLAVRTRQSVIYADASQDPAVRDDPYVSARKVRSMLCAPLLFKGRALGAIYLENNLFEGLFGPERLEILHLLAAQAAVSFNNALVYESLERMVDERTRELRSTQQQLVDAARKAGMAEVAGSAMHNVGNALNSVMVLRMQLSERIAGSRVPRLGQVAQLLKAHRDDLAGFLSDDPRGQRLIEYVDELARHLAAEQEAAAGELAELGECVARIRDIVSDQLRNAGMKLIVEPVMVSSVVEDALRVGLNRAERAHHGIEVVCELSDEARVETDRHRLLQIVTNLITNARRAVCHAVGPDRRVLVRCAPREGGGCSVEVEDTGVGIASDHLARLFQQGFTTWPEGTGLGLHASVLEARLLGADLRVESDGPGQGARFTLELPATAPRSGKRRAEALA
ncbi:hypothetical protein BE04_11935 [Sorangium cellulosum]|uniref:histidine kinase n=1 Tax=Sorangium cellulosum TaxID=56 RepID=A0A150NYX4_SORCE|nr:hypothetical protein BE04_11935 [Sorangium cellulosum]